jgi:hypothetical protein
LHRKLTFLFLATSGGLGLTGGIADVGSLYDSLIGMHMGLADDSILDTYAEIRRKIYFDVIDPLSRENFRRLWDQDPEKASENDEFFQICHRAEKDEALATELALVCFVPLALEGSSVDNTARD